MDDQLPAKTTEFRERAANGELDPNDDAAWSSYLAQLDTLGLAQYQAQSQAIYDRQLSE